MTQLHQHPSGIVQQWFTQKKDDDEPRRRPNRTPPPDDDPPPPRRPSQPVEVPGQPRPAIRPDKRQARMPEPAPTEVPLGHAYDRVRLPRTADVPVPRHYRNPNDEGGTA